MLGFGPEDATLLRWMHDGAGLDRHGRERLADAVELRARAASVLYHEVTHVAHGVAWGPLAPGHPGISGAAHAEREVVQEAFSDLVQAAHMESPNIGYRDLRRLTNGTGSLEHVRAGIRAAVAAGSHDPHVGVQVLTRPALALAHEHGWRAVAEVTGGAINRIGAAADGLAPMVVDLPGAADALHHAAAVRWGMDDAAVVAARRGWQALGVLR